MTIRRALFVGLGSIGQRHLRNLKKLRPDVEVSAYRARGSDFVLSDRMEIESPDGLADRYSIRVHRDLPAALKDKPDVVFVTNPSSLHVAASQAAVDAGCAVFVEKPLSDDWNGVERLVQSAEQKRAVGFVGYQLRFHPLFRLIQRWLADRRLGKIVGGRFVVAEYMPHFHRYEDYRGTYAARRDLGGGSVLTQIHEIDLIYALFGLPDSVYAVGGRLSSLEIDVEDVASSIFEFRRDDGRSFPIHLHQDYLQRPPQRSAEIYGEHGKIIWDHVEGTARRFDAAGRLAESTRLPHFERNQLFLDEMAHFLACVENGERPLVSLSDGAQSLRMALAVRRSLAARAVESLDRVTA